MIPQPSPLQESNLGERVRADAPFATRRPAQARGYAEMYGRYAKLLGETLYLQRAKMIEVAGPPWQQRSLAERDALTRLLEYDVPDEQYVKRMQGLSQAQLAAAALDAIKLVTRAAERGDPEAQAYIGRKRGQGGIAPAAPLPPVVAEAASVPPAAPFPAVPVPVAKPVAESQVSIDVLPPAPPL